MALIGVLRAALADREGLYAGVSQLPNECGVWARILAADGAVLKTALTDGWAATRQALIGTRPAPRRK